MPLDQRLLNKVSATYGDSIRVDINLLLTLTLAQERPRVTHEHGKWKLLIVT